MIRRTLPWPLICLVFASCLLSSSSYSPRSKLPVSVRCISKVARFRSSQVHNLLPQSHEDKRYDVCLSSAPVEKMVEIKENGTSPVNYKVIIPVVTILAVAAAAVASGKFGTFDFAQVVEQSASKIEKMGPYGYLYFALVSFSLVFCLIDESALRDSHVDVNLTSKPQFFSNFNVAFICSYEI